MGEADQLLGQVCPEFTDTAGEGTTLEDLAPRGGKVAVIEMQQAFRMREGGWAIQVNNVNEYVTPKS
jgi:hypothetical protein